MCHTALTCNDTRLPPAPERTVVRDEHPRASRAPAAVRRGPSSMNAAAVPPIYQVPYTASVLAVSTRQVSPTASPSWSAIARTVIGMTYGALGRPRYGVGVR